MPFVWRGRPQETSYSNSVTVVDHGVIRDLRLSLPLGFRFQFCLFEECF